MTFLQKLLVIILIFIGLNSPSFSQTITTEAPSVSASAVTVPNGGLQGELSIGATFIETSNPGSRNFELPFLLVRYGLSDRFELRLQTRSEIVQIVGVFSEFGFSDLGVGAKYAILPNDGSTNLAVIANFSPFYRNWKAQNGNLLLAFSQSFGEGHSIGTNVGYSRFRDNKSVSKFRMNSFAASLVYSYQFLDRFTVFCEGYYNLTQSLFLQPDVKIDPVNSFGVDFGLQFLLRDNIQLDYVSAFNLLDKVHFHSLGFNILLDTKKK